MTSLMFHHKEIVSAQLPDRIFVRGKWLDLFTNPLEQFWQLTHKKRPSFCTRYNCTRGYVAKWDIKDNELYLLSIEGNFFKRNLFFQRKRIACTLNSIFRKSVYHPVKAFWFSGKLRIPQGQMLEYEHEKYNSRFEKETIITVEKGNIVKSVTINNKEHELYVNYEIIE